MPFTTLPATGNRVFYEIQHIPAAPSENAPVLTLLMLHGLGSSHCFYDATISHLISLQLQDGEKNGAGTRRPLRVVRVDTEGSGLSPLRDEISDAIARGGTGGEIMGGIKGLAGQAGEFLEVVLGGEGDVVVVGHSMSGITACEVAIAHRDQATGRDSTGKSGGGIRVVGTVLIGPAVPSEAVAKVFDERIPVVRRDGMLPLASTIPTKATGSASTPTQRAFIRSLLCSQDPRGYIALCHCISSATVPDYANVSVPTLIIAGREDMSAPLHGCERIASEMGAEYARLEVLDRVGHWHGIEAPEAVAGLLWRFLEERKFFVSL